MSCCGNGRQCIQTVMLSCQFPVYRPLKIAFEKDIETVIVCPRKCPACFCISAKPFFFTPASPLNDSFQGRIALVNDQTANSGDCPDQMVKLCFDGRNIGKNIGMIEFKIVQYGRSWPIVDKFAALVKKSGIVFIRFNHKKRRRILPVQSGGNTEIERYTANKKPWRITGIL